ncbi:hypothetical protein P5V15_001149 [Pogonomyrmex californicus]
MGAFLSEDRQNEIDHVYGVYFDESGSMLGGKRFDVAADDSVIVGDARYPSTPGLYELIFKRLPDDVVYTENDKQMYKSILLTNAHRRDHNALMPVLGTKVSSTSTSSRRFCSIETKLALVLVRRKKEGFHPLCG